jgi:maltose/moltooligosaccharide transporter
VGAALYEKNPAYPFWMGSVLVVVASLLVFIFIKEPAPAAASEAAPGEAAPSLITSLKDVLRDPDRSALRILLAIFFWFLGYTAIEAFFTLYARNYLNVGEANGARLMSELSLIFVLFALPAGYIGGALGRRRTIMAGIVIMAAVLAAIYFIPVEVLTRPLAKLPLVGIVPAPGQPAVLVVIGGLMMTAGVGWAMININSLPMVVDMTDLAKVGTYTGLYYLFSTFSAIVGPNSNGWIISLTGNNYNSIMLVAPIFMLAALGLMAGVKRGEAAK